MNKIYPVCNLGSGVFLQSDEKTVQIGHHGNYLPWACHGRLTSISDSYQDVGVQ